MSKTGLIALHEYLRHVRKRGFLLGLLSVPIVIVLMIGLIFLVMSIMNNTTPLGYVDHSGLLADPVSAPPPAPPDKPVPILAFADEQAAHHALETGEIQGYFILPQ